MDYNATMDNIITAANVHAANTTLTEDFIPEGNDLYEGPTTIALYVCMGLFGVLANGFAIFILSQSVSMRKKLVNVFLINQSSIDLAASVFLLLLGYNKSDAQIVTFSGTAADLYCKLAASRLPLWSMLTSSTWNLVFVNLERYISVAFPIFHKMSIKKWHVCVSITGIWLFGPVIRFFLTFLTSGYADGKCFKAQKWPSKQVSIFASILNICLEFFVPLLIMICCYVFILKTIRSRIDTNAGPQERKKLSANRNILKTMALVTIVFIICWLPNSVIFFNFVIGNIQELTGPVYHLSVYLVFLNCLLNPIIYSAQYKDFQLQIKKIFGRKKVGNTQETNSIQTGTSNIPL